MQDWLRSLPGGLWASASPKVRLDLEKALLEDTSPGGSSQATSVPNHRASRMALLIKQGVPPQQRELLLWLLDFLVDFALHSANSKMGIEQECELAHMPRRVSGPSD